MARINIEDCWWTDPRRSALIKAVGSEELADGIAIKAWRVAQTFWKTNKGLVPSNIFRTLSNAAELISSGLAEVRGESVYVRGSSAYLDWVREKHEQASDAGKKSAESRKKKTGSAQPQPRKTRTKLERTPNEPRTESNDAEPSDSVSGSSSDSDSFSGSSSGVVGAGLKEPQTQSSEPPTPTALTWRAYSAAYQSRYKSPATWNGKIAGQLKQFVTRVPAVEAPDIAAFYLGHNGQRYLSSGHAIGLMLMDAEKLRTEWLTGRRITSLDARHAESGDSLKNQIERLTKGEV